MPTRTGLAVYCYTAPTNANYPLMMVEIGGMVSNLAFASASPGGYTTFSATLPLRDTRIPVPAFQLFSLVAVMSGANPVWLGEMTDPALGMDETQGDYLRLGALGLGNALRDDPMVISYTGQTVKQMATDQLARRTNGSPYHKFATIASDQSYIFPDNPAGTYAPVYDNRTMEEIIADIVALAGDYYWGVVAHPARSAWSNSAGFPLGVLQVHQRDTTTTAFSVSRGAGDIRRFELTPSSERAYNYAEVDYSTPTGGVGKKFSIDSRLNPTDYSQNTAPFRFRKLTRDYTGTSTVTAAIAQNLASGLQHLYNSPSNKAQFVLSSINDAQGNRLPLWEGAQADANIFVRDLAVRGYASLPTTPSPGVNQFYILNATYTEGPTDATLTLECDNFYDKTATQVARLTLAQDQKNRSTKTQGNVQAQGAAAVGYATIGQSNAVSGQLSTGTLQWPVLLYQTPTGCAFTQVVRTNLNTPSMANATTLGAIIQASASASSTVQGAWTFSTSGNCLRAIHAQTLDWHCDGCDKEFRGLSINEHLVTHTQRSGAPGDSGMAIACPECAGFSEAFNTGLRGADEGEEMRARHPFRAEQARLIRQLMRHGAVLLETHP